MGAEQSQEVTEIRMAKPGPLTLSDRDRAIGTIVTVEKAKGDTAESKQVTDPFQDMYGEGTASRLVKPPANLLELSQLWERSTMLGQCIEAMEVNCDGLGHRLISRLDDESELPDTIKKQMDIEKARVTNFFNYASVEEPELSFTDLRRKKRRDQEATGGAWWEALRSATGELMGFNTIPSHTVRWGKLTDDPVETQQKMLFTTPEGKLVWSTRTVYRRLRVAVQIRSHLKSYFKVFGDPRTVDCRSGDEASPNLEFRYRANEIVYFPCLWAPRTPYGIPRWIGNLFSIYGSRSAEQINYFTFENNNIPSMALMVSNGLLTDGSIARIKQFTESQLQGQKNYSQFLILEAEPVGEGVNNPGAMHLDVKPLKDNQHTDELFQAYDDNNRKKIRGAFRLPPIFLGVSDDYNRATAQVSKVITDEQVFNPERASFDEFVNRVILPELGVTYWAFKSNTPDTTDNETLVKLLTAAEKAGGATPQIARDVVGDVFSRDLGAVKAIDPHIPMSIQLAREMKNASDPGASLPSAAGPVEAIEKALNPLEKMSTQLEGMYSAMYDRMWDDLEGVDEDSLLEEE